MMTQFMIVAMYLAVSAERGWTELPTFHASQSWRPSIDLLTDLRIAPGKHPAGLVKSETDLPAIDLAADSGATQKVSVENSASDGAPPLDEILNYSEVLSQTRKRIKQACEAYRSQSQDRTGAATALQFTAWANDALGQLLYSRFLRFGIGIQSHEAAADRWLARAVGQREPRPGDAWTRLSFAQAESLLRETSCGPKDEAGLALLASMQGNPGGEK
jgi:hypothetical protein